MKSVRARVWLADGRVSGEALCGCAPVGASGCRIAPVGMGAAAAMACFGATAPSAALGPLALAAWDVDAESRDVGFALTLGSVGEDGVLREVPPLTEEESALVWAQLPRLQTGRLAIAVGDGTDHALLWRRGSTDLGCVDWPASIGHPIAKCLPAGDGEPMLRRLIDDSVNLLDGLAANHRRREEGLAPANVLWPWSPGRPFPPQSVPARLGIPCWAVADGWLHRGAARVAGFRPAEADDDPPGLTVRVERWAGLPDPEEEAFELRRDRTEGWLRPDQHRFAACAVVWPSGGAAWPWEPGVPWHSGVADDLDAEESSLGRWVGSLARLLSR